MENADSSLIYFGPLENLAYCLPRPVYLSSPWRDDDRRFEPGCSQGYALHYRPLRCGRGGDDQTRQRHLDH
jgi:hypothetical protein